MFHRFSDSTRQVVVLSQEAARELGHSPIEPEHLLLGLMRQGENMAAETLQRRGIWLNDLRSQVKEDIGQCEERPGDHIPFSPRSKEILAQAVREAAGLGHRDIGPEHVLLAVVHQGSGVLEQMLTPLGVDLAGVRELVVEELKSDPIANQLERIQGSLAEIAETLKLIAQRMDIR